MTSSEPLPVRIIYDACLESNLTVVFAFFGRSGRCHLQICAFVVPDPQPSPPISPTSPVQMLSVKDGASIVNKEHNSALSRLIRNIDMKYAHPAKRMPVLLANRLAQVIGAGISRSSCL
jgi:hypothetical protein